MHEKRGKQTGRHIRPRRWRLALLWLAMLALLVLAAAAVVIAAYRAGAGIRPQGHQLPPPQLPAIEHHHNIHLHGLGAADVADIVRQQEEGR